MLCKNSFDCKKWHWTLSSWYYIYFSRWNLIKLLLWWRNSCSERFWWLCNGDVFLGYFSSVFILSPFTEWLRRDSTPPPPKWTLNWQFLTSFLIYICFRVSITVIKLCDLIAAWQGKVYFGLHFLITVCHWVKLRQELEART